MLDTLRSIVQDVNSAPIFPRRAGRHRARVREAMGTEVCSIYLRGPGARPLPVRRDRRPEQGRGRSPVSRAWAGTGRARRHARRADQPRRRDAATRTSTTCPKSAKNRSTRSSACRSSSSGRCSACWWCSSATGAASTKAKKRSWSRCRRSWPASSRTPRPPAISRLGDGPDGTAGLAFHRRGRLAGHRLRHARSSSIRPRFSKACRTAKRKTSPSN